MEDNTEYKLDGYRVIHCNVCDTETITICNSDSKELECPVCHTMVEIDTAEDFPPDLGFIRLDCLDCGNSVWVLNHPDYTPKFCAYCGVEFLHYEDIPE